MTEIDEVTEGSEIKQEGLGEIAESAADKDDSETENNVTENDSDDQTVTIQTLGTTSEIVWCNASKPSDANSDGEITSLDALVVINALSRYGSVSVSSIGRSNSSTLVDINNDTFITALDALLVINTLSRHSLAAVSQDSSEAEETYSQEDSRLACPVNTSTGELQTTEAVDVAFADYDLDEDDSFDASTENPVDNSLLAIDWTNDDTVDGKTDDAIINEIAEAILS